PLMFWPPADARTADRSYRPRHSCLKVAHGAANRNALDRVRCLAWTLRRRLAPGVSSCALGVRPWNIAERTTATKTGPRTAVVASTAPTPELEVARGMNTRSAAWPRCASGAKESSTWQGLSGTTGRAHHCLTPHQGRIFERHLAAPTPHRVG